MSARSFPGAAQGQWSSAANGSADGTASPSVPACSAGGDPHEGSHPAGSTEESFRTFETLIQKLAAASRFRELARVVELMSDELQSRSFTLTWTLTPPLGDRSIR